jgi:DNA-binding response OmpR family regulator
MKRVLIIEQHVYMMQLMSKEFDDRGYSVHAVYDLADAKMNLRRYDFHLIIIGGFDQETKELMELAKTKNLKVFEGRPTNEEFKKLTSD